MRLALGRLGPAVDDPLRALSDGCCMHAAVSAGLFRLRRRRRPGARSRAQHTHTHSARALRKARARCSSSQPASEALCVLCAIGMRMSATASYDAAVAGEGWARGGNTTKRVITRTPCSDQKKPRPTHWGSPPLSPHRVAAAHLLVRRLLGLGIGGVHGSRHGCVQGGREGEEGESRRGHDHALQTAQQRERAHFFLALVSSTQPLLIAHPWPRAPARPPCRRLQGACCPPARPSFPFCCRASL